MPKVVKAYVKYVEAMNQAVGKFVMFWVFAMMAILLYDAITRTIFNIGNLWAVEVAQFLMAAYYLIGGGYSVILGGHVRMDLLYSRWSPKRQALMDVITGLGLLFYIVILFKGSIDGVEYALRYKQINYTPWGPPLAPIKIFMSLGILLMLLQVIASFFKNLAKATGRSIT